MNSEVLMVIDSGNTRLKWSIIDGQFRRVNFVWQSDKSQIENLWSQLPKPARCLVANVAGPKVSRYLTTVSRDLWGIGLKEIKGERESCGVTNCYIEPSLLGADRWASLIAAHQLFKEDVLVISLGTANTIDMLCGDGRFVGGVIIPGLDMMVKSLSDGAHDLSITTGQEVLYPNNTEDAITTGTFRAVVGAIKEMCQQMLRERERVPKLIFTGGNSNILKKFFKQECIIHENLVIDGLVTIGQSS